MFFSPCKLFGKGGKLLQKPRPTKVGAAISALFSGSTAAPGNNRPDQRVKYGLPVFSTPIDILSSSILLAHPATPCPAVRAIAVQSTMTADGGLRLHYRIDARPADIRLPAPCPAAAADELWRHTCAEAFIATVDGPEYREFNFSPTGQWAVYRFTAYRQRDMRFRPPAAPRIKLQRATDHIVLTAHLAPALLPPGGQRRVGLSVVIETADGDKSYWALAHDAAQPDFHLRSSFILALP